MTPRSQMVDFQSGKSGFSRFWLIFCCRIFLSVSWEFLGNYFLCVEKNSCLVNHGFCRFCRFAKSARTCRCPAFRQVAKTHAFFIHAAATLLPVCRAARNAFFFQSLFSGLSRSHFLLIASFARQVACFAGGLGDLQNLQIFAEFADFCRFCRFSQIYHHCFPPRHCLSQ